MKKKLSYIALGLAAIALAGCSQIEEPQSGGATVSLTIGAPEALTRAADGTAVNMLEYAVYDLETGASTPVERGTVTQNVAFPMGLDLQLITGRQYGILLWAANQNSPYSVSAEGILTVDYDKATANSEALDGFYAYNTLSLNGNTQLNVSMKRPFAMVNIGASSLPGSGAMSSLSVSNAPSELNLITGEITGTTETATFGYASIPGDLYDVNGYSTLAYAYVLATDEPQYYTLSYSYKVDNGDPVEQTVENVALQANYRTNIYGSLPGTESNYAFTVSTSEDLQQAIEEASNNDAILVKAGTYTFPNTSVFSGKTGLVIECENGVVFSSETAINLNINGNTIINAKFTNPSTSMSAVAISGWVNGVFKDCVFEGSNALLSVKLATGTIFDGCTFNATYNSTYDYALDDSNGSESAEFINCVFTGKATGRIKLFYTNATFTGCTFSRFIAINSTVEFTKCNINGSRFLLYSSSKLTFTNCTSNGNKALEFSDVEGATKEAGAQATIDGVTKTSNGKDWV